MLFDYFHQKFAQVTNPPLDWEREEIVTSLESAIGPEPNLLEDSELHAKKILIPLPVINSDEMAQLKRLDKAKVLGGYYRPFVVKGLYQVAGGGKALGERLEEIFAEVDEPSRAAATSSCCPTVIPTTRGARSVTTAHQRRAAPPAAQAHPHADLDGRRGRRCA